MGPMPTPDENETTGSLPSLESLQSRIDTVKSSAGVEKQSENSSYAANGIGDAMRIGIELVSGVAVGAVAGFFLDRWLHTMPLFFIVGLLLGAAAGFRNMIREVNRNIDK